MNQTIRLSKVILYGLVFLLFFQLVADFIETIYAFGLLGTNIPPEIFCVLFFFSPLILLAFHRELPRQSATSLIVGAAIMRACEVVLQRGGKMITSGLGTGFLLVLLPVWLAQSDAIAGLSAEEMGAGLTLGVAGSILFRTLGAGTDLTLLVPWLSWILTAITIALAVWALRKENSTVQPVTEPIHGSLFPGALLEIGIMGALAVLYFGFTSPTVLARWSGVDYMLIIGLLSLTMGLFATSLAMGWLPHLPRPVAWFWNGLFIFFGTTAIWMNQVRFPSDRLAFPIDQPDLTSLQQAPFLIMIILSPVVVYDFLLLIKEIRNRSPNHRRLAGGFTLGVVFFLLVVFMQVFTTVYDYIPVVGPWLRDRFWMVFLVASLGTSLPVLITRPIKLFFGINDYFNLLFIPLIGAFLLAATGWVILSQPQPAPSGSQNLLRVVTYNIQQGYSADGVRSYTQQLAVLKALKPDIIGLEESDVARFSGGNADEVRTISEGLGMAAYYGPRTVTGTFGIALLTRLPLENPHTFFMASAGEQTAAILAQIKINGIPYTILVTHLGNGGPFIQLQQVISRLQGMPNVIAMGDFNFMPDTPQYALSLQKFSDAWVQAGSPPTQGIDSKTLIDHVFISPGMKVKSATYINSPASDHPALEVEINP